MGSEGSVHHKRDGKTEQSNPLHGNQKAERGACRAESQQDVGPAGDMVTFSNWNSPPTFSTL